ncbi:hypothetical protein [Cellulosimicrobium protaetiae]|uniref:Meckel syndrome type 1 protein n=1 Tax=Cellulosimicrobium protaetiae TaxID=2587808 RepID=A0A6M5UGS5_9MICO|nr:hypothetical protein [Cellulosimicrobium protaetiae]QJW36363.1 hypothetical protein FIC82_009340 [Cellulosimicrobium protaetiae]
MSDNGNMQPVRPLTRREMREREQAAAAERSAQPAAPPPAPAPGGAWQQPARPAAPAAPPPSRRTLRETTGPTDHPGQPSVVRPPAASGGMRGLDETGRLTPVQETAERVAIRPPAPTPVVPTRTSSRPPAGAPRPVPGSSGPVRPPTSAAPAGGLGAQAPVGRVGAPDAAPAQPQRLSAFSAPTAAPAAPAATPAPAPAPSPWGATPAPAPERAPAVPPAAAPAEAPGAALPWSAITSGSAPESAGAAREPASPFGGVRETAAAAPPAGGPSDDLFPRVRARADELDDEADDDLDDEPRGPSYTWLHYLILVAVAFVLGLLVWTLVSRDDPGLATEETSASGFAVSTWDDPGTFATGR